MTPTPKTLRELFDTWRSSSAWTLADVAFYVNAAADAWKADITLLNKYRLWRMKAEQDMDDLRKRLEASEKARQRAESVLGRVGKLLDDQRPGLSSWWYALEVVRRELAALAGETKEDK